MLDYYVNPALAYATKFEVLNEIQWRATNQGVISTIDDFTDDVSSSQYNAYKQNVYRQVEMYLREMVRFLNSNEQAGDYPNYDGNGNDINESGDQVRKVGGMLFYGEPTRINSRLDDNVYPKRKND